MELKTYTEHGINNLIDNIKILLYKERPTIFDTLDFNSDEIYQEPLFFAYFKNKEINKEYLDSILFGYSDSQLQKESILAKSDDFGRIYLPNIGWIITGLPNRTVEINRKFELEVTLNGNNVLFKLEKIKYINDSRIELLKYQVDLLNQFYYDENLKLVSVEIEEISNKQLQHLELAFRIIQKYLPYHFELIELVTKKVVIFNVDTTSRNSFATLSAHGVAFLNSYQESYNEVFFIDDIAHQTGHIIFNALLYNINDFIKLEPSTIVQEVKNDNGVVLETRDIHVVFHALYTYYTTFICFDEILENKVFSGEKLHEIFGRIRFYLGKCSLDLNLIEKPYFDRLGPESFFTPLGLEIYTMIKNKYIGIKEKWYDKVVHLQMQNQLYNFSYSHFAELNPHEDI